MGPLDDGLPPKTATVRARIGGLVIRVPNALSSIQNLGCVALLNASIERHFHEVPEVPVGLFLN
jgi:hypothetical protein